MECVNDNNSEISSGANSEDGVSDSDDGGGQDDDESDEGDATKVATAAATAATAATEAKTRQQCPHKVAPIDSNCRDTNSNATATTTATTARRQIRLDHDSDGKRSKAATIFSSREIKGTHELFITN